MRVVTSKLRPFYNFDHYTIHPPSINADGPLKQTTPDKGSGKRETPMWTCPNCKTDIEDSYSHCWNCGSKQPVVPRTTQPARVASVPQFASIETEPNLPKVKWWWFRLPGARIVILLVMAGILKVLSSTFLGTYGLYIFIGVAVLAMVIILWRFFRRDPSEGVGIEL